MENQDFYNNQNAPVTPTPPVAPVNKLGIFATVLGVFAILGSMTLIPGILMGIGSITLGVISRIYREKFDVYNALGITFGIIALFLCAVLFLGTLILLQEPEVMAEFQKMMQYYYTTPMQ